MIREYKPGDLKSGFVGVRVAVSVNGKVKQKWYGHTQYAHPTAMRLAQEQERKWKQMQLDKQRNAVQSRINNTGITGLCMVYNMTRRKTKREYYYPTLQYQYRRKGKAALHVWYLPKDFSLSHDLWHEICRTIKNVRTLRNKTYLKILQQKPDTVAYFRATPPPYIFKDSAVSCETPLSS